jgi:ABC-type antimicrobial peptide transport system permease subunit
MGENLEYSSIDMGSSDVVASSIEGIQERNGQKYVSPELYLGTEVTIPNEDQPRMGLVRGVKPSVLLVRRQVEIEQGQWPKAGEAIVGRLAATKLGAKAEELAIGKTIKFEGREWRISGTFTAGGAAFESEIWCRLDELQQAMKRQDLSLVAITLAPGADFSNVELFCMERLDLELQAIQETDYYATLQKDYRPVRMLAWLVVLLVAGAGIFAGLNTMYGSVVGRIRELATLQTIGFARLAMLISLVQEGLILAAAASLCAAFIALIFVNKASVRFTMGAFALQVDDVAVLIGCGVGLSLGLFGAIPPAIRALRMQIVDGLKAT